MSAPAQLQAMLGRPVTLSCNVTIKIPEVLKQVRWLDSKNQSVLHYQPEKPSSLTRRDGVELLDQQMHTSAIAIERTKPGDEGCYTCVFDVYPTGQKRGKTCLFLNGKVMLALIILTPDIINKKKKASNILWLSKASSMLFILTSNDWFFTGSSRVLWPGKDF